MKKLLLTFLSVFSLLAYSQQSISPLEICSEPFNTTVVVDLTVKNQELVGNQNLTNYTITFHTNFNDANQNVNPISNPQAYVTTSTVIYARVVNNTTNVATVFLFEVIVNNWPIADIGGLTACFSEGVVTFDLGSLAEQIWFQNNTTPNFLQVSFHNNQNDAENQINALPFNFTTQDTTTTIFVYASFIGSNCTTIFPITLVGEDCSTSGCNTPVSLFFSTITQNTVILGWTSSTPTTEIFIAPAGSPAPIATSTGIISTANPFTIVALECGTSYQVYIRAVCEPTLSSSWSQPLNFTTLSCNQGVSVTSETAQNLVSQVLLAENCGTPTNITSQGACGIGYFNNNGGAFPFDEGVIIRSGNVQFSGNSFTNTNTSTTCSGTSDINLQNLITASGQTGTINDVSSISFDFTANSNTLVFDFIFASNEYGNFQCNFSDVIGFFLTDIETGITQNIALVPGTSLPVSTTTIRNSQFNSGCVSVNPQFFDVYNVNNPQSTINFIGQTVPMTAIASLVPDKDYKLKIAVGDYQDNMFDSAVFIRGGSLAFGNQCNESIQLQAFVDSNSNGIKDADEIIFSQGTFNYTINNQPNIIEGQSPSGLFLLYPENLTDSFSVSFSVYPELASFFGSTTSFPNLVYQEGNQNIYYFPVTVLQPYNDVSVSITPLFAPVSGFSYQHKIEYRNNGITPASGTLVYEKSPNVSITSISQNGTMTIPNGFSYDYINLAPNEVRTIFVTLQVPPIPTVNLGDIVETSVTSNNTGDLNLENNTAVLEQVVVGSYDPNDKLIAQGDTIDFANFSEDDYLYYTIRFQNTGTANAQFVRIEDVLEETLDEASIRMISASHAYTLTRAGNLLTWQFDQINLPPNIVNEPASNGYVHFKIKPKPGFQIGDVIKNTAAIFFDFNPPIITNTVETEFVEVLSNQEFSTLSCTLAPNPATDFISIQLNNTAEVLQSVVIFDTLGKKVISKNNLEGMQIEVNCSVLQKGVYYTEITTQNNKKIIKKLVIQ